MEQEARVVEEEARVVEVVMEQLVEGAPCAASSGGARTTRCTKRCNCERRSSSHSAEKPTPLTRIVCTVALCFSGSGGTMTPGYFALSCACTCGAAHACSQHAARSMRWAVAARAQGEAAHQDALRVGGTRACHTRQAAHPVKVAEAARHRELAKLVLRQRGLGGDLVREVRRDALPLHARVGHGHQQVGRRGAAARARLAARAWLHLGLEARGRLSGGGQSRRGDVQVLERLAARAEVGLGRRHSQNRRRRWHRCGSLLRRLPQRRTCVWRQGVRGVARRVRSGQGGRRAGWRRRRRKAGLVWRVCTP